MDIKRMQLMATMLKELEDGRWTPTGHLSEFIKVNHVDLTFDLGEWGEQYDRHTDPGTIDCGFSACAIGFALLDTRFNEQGLYDPDTAHVSLDADDIPDLAPRYDGKAGFEAVKEFFDIDQDMADYLFHEDYYESSDITPGDVLKRVEEVIELETL